MQAPDSHQGDIIPCCACLRTKSQYFVPDEMEAGPGTIKVSTTATYWCTRTSTALGPDDAPSTPQRCQPGRACFEQPP